MAFEPNFEKVASSYRVKLGNTQAVIECKLPANDNTEVNKILCANAKAYISNVEVLDGEIGFNGFSSFLVIYESGEGATHSLDYSAEFKDKYKNSQIELGDVASITANVVDVNTSNVAGSNDVKIVAVVEINIDLIKTAQTDVLVGVNSDEVFTQNEVVGFTSLASVENETFEITQDLEIRDSVSEILNVCNSVHLEAVTPNNGFLTVRGGVNSNVIYLTNAETPQIRSYQTNFDFTQEISNSTVTTASAVHSLLSLLYSDIKVTTSLATDRAVVSLVLPVNYVGFIFNNYEVDSVTDLFSTANELTTTTQSITSIVPQSSLYFNEKINGSVVVDENTPFIDELLGNCCNHVVLASSYVTDETLVVEGIAYTTVLYLNKETNTNHSIEVEIPFSLNLMTHGLNEGSVPLVEISLSDILTRCKRGREIEVNANVDVFADFYTEKAEAVISNVVVGEEKGEPDCVLSVYIAKPGDTLWSVAKYVNMSPDMLLEQNPTLELPLVGGERIIVYRQKEILF